MKRIVLALIIVSSVSHAYSAVKCDLNVAVNEYGNGRQIQVLGKGTDEAQWGARPNSESKALQDCINKGGQNCRVEFEATNCTYHSNGSELLGGIPGIHPSYYCEAVAHGTKNAQGPRLSSSEIKKLKQEALCQKLNQCQSDMLNDSESTTNDLEKVEFLKSKNNC